MRFFISIRNSRPPTTTPGSFASADCAISGVKKSTWANPRGRPESWSVPRRTHAIMPKPGKVIQGSRGGGGGGGGGKDGRIGG